MSRRKEFRFSKSSLGCFLDCPRQYYYNTHPEVPKRVDHPRLCGSVVHSLVRMLYKPTREPRPFFFQEKKSLLGYFRYVWKEELAKARAKGELPAHDTEPKKREEAELDEKFFGVGAHCLGNYWDANIGIPRPLQVEKTYRANVWGFPLIGIFDQLRAAPLPWIERHRPELVQNGALNPAYCPVVILDIKTEYESFDAAQFKEHPSQEDVLRAQFELHEGVQATMYTLLHEVTTGKKPVAFVWYHLPSNRWFVTWRENRDYDTLYGILAFCHDNIAAQSFPKHTGRARCKKCDYWDICREDRYFIISRPELPSETQGEPVEQRPNLVEKDPQKQLRFKFRMQRRKCEKPAVTVPRRPPVLRELPWDDELAPPIPNKK